MRPQLPVEILLQRLDLEAMRHECPHRCNAAQNDHRGHHDEAPQESELEFPENGRHLLEERHPLRFLGGIALGHVDAEHVARNSLTHVQRYPSEENGEQGKPLEVFKEGVDERAFSHSIRQPGQADDAQCLEDSDDREQNLEAVHVIVI